MLLICYGTRPEWIKIKPLLNSLKSFKIPFKTLFTGQHENLVEEKADFNLKVENISNNRLNNLCINNLNISDEIFNNIKYVLVQGDTTTVLSLCINCFHRKIKIIHLEAGLRTYNFDNPFPEEMNRQIVSRIVDIHLCPTKTNKQNLLNEKCSGDIYVVGNTVLDNLRDINTMYDDIVIMTLHRRENHDIINKWFLEFSKISAAYRNIKFILPIHPNPNVLRYKHLLTNIDVIESQPHDNMINILSRCKLIITDSGGLQEEGSFLNKKIIVCRKITERPESLGVHSFLCQEPNLLKDMFDKLINDYIINAKCPYGDGYSSDKIINIIKNLKYD